MEAQLVEILSDLRTEVHTLKHDICSLKTRVRYLDAENNAMKQQMMQLQRNNNTNHTTTTVDYSCGAHNQLSAISTEFTFSDLGTSLVPTTPGTSGTHGYICKTQRYAPGCDFCTKWRCKICEDKVGMMPALITLLMKNGWLGVKELGRLACVCPLFRRYICHDSDEDMWSHLVLAQRPSLALVPDNLLKGLSYRTWFERLTSLKVAGHVRNADSHKAKRWIVDKLIECKRELMAKGLTLANVPTPSLTPADVLMLIDVRYNNQPLITAIVRGDEFENAFSNDKEYAGRIFIPNNVQIEPIELKLNNRGQFRVDMSKMTGTVHIVRLTDYKVICCVHNCLDGHLGRTSNTNFDGNENNIPTLSDELQNTDGYLSFYSHNRFGAMPTLLTSRLTGNEPRTDFCRGFCFDFERLDVTIPRSPWELGYHTTLETYRVLTGRFNNNRRVIAFDTFRKKYWENAAKNDDLDIFFEQCATQKSSDGKYYAHVCSAPKGLTIDIHPFFDVGEESIDFGANAMGGVTLLHVLEDLFESSEYSPLDLNDL